MKSEIIFDLEKTLRRLDGNQELYQELIRFFLEDSPVLLNQLHQGYRDQDAKLVERVAHTLKGLAANFGANRAVQSAQRVEQAAGTGHLGEGGEAIVRLEQDIVLLQDALQPLTVSPAPTARPGG
jgi:two-component system, sensor histidine kinase and response regulator